MIITQNLINMATIILKEAFIKALTALISPVITELFNDCNTLEETMTMIKMHSCLMNIAIKALEIAIPKIDDLYLKSEYRKTNFYKVATYHKNRVLLFGELSYERHYYTNKNKKEGFYLIDELFNFEKYTTYSPEVRALLIDNSVKTNTNLTSVNTTFLMGNYKDYMTRNKFKNIPRQTIYSWIKKWNIPRIEYKPFEGVSNLYVMIDEKWLHEQIRLATLPEEERTKHHYIMSKCFVTFTGVEIKSGRRVLLNRHVFMTTSDNPWKEFIDEIYKIYNFEEIQNIYSLSDAGIWILAGTNELKLYSNNKVIVNICEFHVKEYINRLTKSKDNRKKLIDCIYDNPDKKEFNKLADEIISKAQNKKKKTQYKNYVLNHWKGIQNMKDREIKSSMESHISHCIANSFGSRPKGYSKSRIQKYIKLEEYKQNDINIMYLYLKSFNKAKDEYIFGHEEISFSMFDKDTSILPVRSSYSPLSQLFHNIAYGF